MAKKDSTYEGCAAIGCLILVVILITIFTLTLQTVALILPVGFLLMAISNIVDFKKDKQKLFKKYFWLSPFEAESFKEAAANLHYAMRAKNSAQSQAAEENIAINQNGRISARSYRGKALQQTIDQSNAVISDSSEAYGFYQELPVRRWRNARKHYSNAIGFGMAFIIWATFMLIQSDNIITSYKSLFSEMSGTVEWGTSTVGSILEHTFSFSDENATKTTGKTDVKKEESKEKSKEKESEQKESDTTTTSYVTPLFLAAAVLIVIAYGIMKVVGLIVFLIRFRKPPFVDIDNVDLYTAETC